MMNTRLNSLLWVITGLAILVAACGLYAEEKIVDLTVSPESDTAIGYGEGFEDARTLVLQLRPAGGYYIDYSACQDNAGENLWYQTKANSKLHVWQTYGVLPNFKYDGSETESHAAVFHGLLGVIDPSSGSGSLEFDVEVNDVDIDVDALGRHVDAVWTPTDPEAEPELSEVEDKCEAGTDGGLGMPIKDNVETLPETITLGENVDPGKMIRVCINAKKAGTLVFSGMGSDVAIYTQSEGQQTKVTNSISISEGAYQGEFYLHAKTSFDAPEDAVNIVAEFQCAGDTRGTSQDTVRIYPKNTTTYDVYVNRAIETDDYVPVETCGRVPITVKRNSGTGATLLHLEDTTADTNDHIQFYESKEGGSGSPYKEFYLPTNQESITFWISGGPGDRANLGDRTITLEDDLGNPLVSMTVTVVDVTLSLPEPATAVVIAPASGSNLKITHFVAPKGAMLNKVTLIASIDAGEGITINPGLVDWVTATEQSNPLIATVPRNAARRYPVMLTIGRSEIKEARVWVLWSKVTAEDDPNYPTQVNSIAATNANGKLKITGGYKVCHEIFPKTIFTDVDRPDLAGDRAESSPPNVSENDSDVYNKTVSLAGGADKKWDASQQVRQKCVTAGVLNSVSELQTIPFTTYLNYPTLGVCGNDDTTVDDETNDPYTTEGYITMDDTASRELVHGTGTDGDTVEMRVHLKSFPRVQLGNTWYRIGDDFLWRIHFKFKNDSGTWLNNTSFIDTGNEGFN